MRERPILFSGLMVRAILEGRKTQTRRITKVPSGFSWDNEAEGLITDGKCVLHLEEIKCPHGTIGDRLWVREAFKVSDVRHAPDDHGTMIYTADSTSIEIDGSEFDMNRIKLGKSYPSIHMPRWASRITLEITGVRVERLQEISDADVDAEGVSEIVVPGIEYGPYGDPVQPLDCSATDRDRFGHLWQSINGPESWSANPWVWVIEFRRVVNG